jgi:uridine phosphorylase
VAVPNLSGKDAFASIYAAEDFVGSLHCELNGWFGQYLLHGDRCTGGCRATEVLISLGVSEFLSLGTAGGLQPDQSVTDVVVLHGAVRDEGVSCHYVTPGAMVQPDNSLTASLRDRLVGADLSVSEGMTWTTDAPYRETAEEIAHYRNEGVLTVEMEAAAPFAVAQARRVPLASAAVLDVVFGDPIGAPTMDTSAAFGKLYDVFLVGIEVLAERTTVV